MIESPSPEHNELGGKYRILADLGQGGTATVSLAIARGPSGFSKLVVLKAMKQSLAQEPEFAQMFMNESRLAARLNHPNIVQTNEVFEHHGLPVIVMEYLEGQPFSNVLARSQNTQKFRLPMQLKVISDVLGGLHYSHELRDFDGTPLNLVHRDISPHNVFVTFDGQVKLLDFGIAKLGGSQVETEVGMLKGKIRYMSPEQVTNDHIDRRADIFAVGVILWELSTGTRLWVGLGDAAVMNKLLNGDVPAPSSVNPEVNPELERMVMKALAPKPADRYATAAELQAELDEFLAGLGTQVRPREIGKVVSELFADVRAETQRLIEAQLSRVVSLTDAEYAQARPIELTNLSYTHTGTTRRDALGQAEPVQTPALARRRGAGRTAGRGWPGLVALAEQAGGASGDRGPPRSDPACRRHSRRGAAHRVSGHHQDLPGRPTSRVQPVRAEAAQGRPVSRPSLRSRGP